MAQAAGLSQPIQDCKEISVYLVDESIVHVTLCRESKLNALTPSMYAALAAACRMPSERAALAAIVITGSGAAFTSGADVSGGGSDSIPLHEAPVADFMHAMIDCTVPILIAVNGAAVGIGVTMLPHADVVVADPDAYFMLPFLRNAIVPEFASTLTLPQCLGTAMANDMLMTGRKLSAEEALQAGLVSRISPPGGAAEVALQLAQAMARQPLAAKSCRIFREMMRKHHRAALHSAVTWELQQLDERLANGDAAEAVMQWWASKQEASQGKL